MGMGVDESGKDNHTATVDFVDRLSILSIPAIAQSLARLADCDNLAGLTEDGRIFDNAEVLEIGSAAGTLFGRAQSRKLRDVDQEERWPFPIR